MHKKIPTLLFSPSAKGRPMISLNAIIKVASSLSFPPHANNVTLNSLLFCGCQ